MEIGLLLSLPSFSLQRLKTGLRSPLFSICLAGGLIGLLLPPQKLPHSLQAWLWFLSAPFVEEYTWRALLQNEISRHFPPASQLPNVITSASFALAHMLFSPGWLALATFFPSLVFGFLWSRFYSTWLCGILHLWYNLLFRL